MLIDEVIAIMEYKAKNIKAKISPAYFSEAAEMLKELKKLKEPTQIVDEPVGSVMPAQLRRYIESEDGQRFRQHILGEEPEQCNS